LSRFLAIDTVRLYAKSWRCPSYAFGNSSPLEFIQIYSYAAQLLNRETFLSDEQVDEKPQRTLLLAPATFFVQNNLIRLRDRGEL
jgi:hypothetical protein